MANPADTYHLYGKLPDPWLITLRIDRNGIASCKVREKKEAPHNMEDLKNWSRLDQAPRPGGLNLPCTGISLEWQREDGMWRCEWDFEGSNDPSSVTFGDPVTSTYEIDCSVTTAPLQTHPRFLQICDLYGGKNRFIKEEWQGFPRKLPKKDDAPGGDDNTGDKNPLYGVEEYYVPQMTWRQTSATVQLPADFRQNLGCIDKPRTNGNGPQPPVLQGRANWLKTSARASWRGNLYQTTEEWTASGPDGWNEDIYRPRG